MTVDDELIEVKRQLDIALTELLQLKHEYAQSVRNAHANEAQLRADVAYWQQKARQYKSR